MIAGRGVTKLESTHAPKKAIGFLHLNGNGMANGKLSLPQGILMMMAGNMQ